MGKVLPHWSGTLTAESKHHGGWSCRTPSPQLLSPHPALLFAQHPTPPIASRDICPSSNDTEAVRSLVMLTSSMELANRSEAAGSTAPLISSSCESGPGLVPSTPSTSRNTFVVHEPEETAREAERESYTERHMLFRKGLFL